MKKILIILALLAGAVLVAGQLIPKDYRIEREIVINKPRDFVFHQLKFLKNHDQWNPWSRRDPHIEKKYFGKDGDVGFISAWSGNKEVGMGEEQIMFIAEGEKIETELRFKKPMEDTCRAYLITESVGDQQTKVRWGMTGRYKFPGNIICALMHMQDKIGGDFEEGLKNLKSVLEK